MTRAKQAIRAGTPDWMVTYADTMGLLLCFFVMLASVSEVKENERFRQVMESLRKAFGGGGASWGAAAPEVPHNPLIARLLQIEAADPDAQPGVAAGQELQERRFRVANVPDGLEIVVGGRITFERFSAALKPEARDLVARTAECLRGYNTRVLVRGHATAEHLPEDSLYEDPRDLSYARAIAVAEELERNGVRRLRLIPVAAGDTEPLVRPENTEEKRALNRRVEIMVTEDLVDDYAGSELSDDLKESSSNGT